MKFLLYKLFYLLFYFSFCIKNYLFFVNIFYVFLLDFEYDVEFKIVVEDNVGMDVNVYF